jgi:adenylate cyclase
MFLDLKGSTTIAEKLGHKVYSQFIRDCFHDLTDSVLHYKAEIYQFVGDEVILTWDQSKGLKNETCIHSFFRFKEDLQIRRKYYLKTYNTLPQFHAAMDMGIVTATEIGDIKREIAFHGDVLNTAARILDQCNKYKKEILISENLASHIKNNEHFRKLSIGEIQLRGKKEMVKIFSMEQSNH